MAVLEPRKDGFLIMKVTLVKFRLNVKLSRCISAGTKH